jgi:hypothetical protein
MPIPSINDFRLTLSSGNPVYNPPVATPSSTDTVNMTVTFTNDPLWTTGTIATVQGTIGGLTQGTRYYIRRRSTNLYSFHTSLAGAQGDSSKVTLTASVTNPILPTGVTNTTLYMSPFRGTTISLFDGVASWNQRTSAEFSVALGTLTAGLPYDIFVFDNATNPTLDAPVAWTSATVRATPLVRQDGVWVKSGDTKRRYVGTIYTDTTTTTIMETNTFSTAVSAKLFVFNADNPVPIPFLRMEQTGNWAYTTAAWRQANGSTANQAEVICGLDGRMIQILLEIDISSTANASAQVGLGEDSTTVTSFYATTGLFFPNAATGPDFITPAQMAKMIPIGYHTYTWLEYGGTNVTFTSSFNLDRRSGIFGMTIL